MFKWIFTGGDYHYVDHTCGRCGGTVELTLDDTAFADYTGQFAYDHAVCPEG